jgi:hypothetical protein
MNRKILILCLGLTGYILLVSLGAGFAGTGPQKAQPAGSLNRSSLSSDPGHKPSCGDPGRISGKTLNAPCQHVYYYEPSVSTISGKLTLETFPGPPGYGASPKTDSRETVFILTPDKPVNVLRQSGEAEEGDFNIPKYNVAKIHVTSVTGLKLSAFRNKSVRVSGTLFGAHTGHHHAEVVLEATRIVAR